MLDIYHREATFKIHIEHKNPTRKMREDKRTRDLLYEALHEWTR